MSVRSEQQLPSRVQTPASWAQATAVPSPPTRRHQLLRGGVCGTIQAVVSGISQLSWPSTGAALTLAERAVLSCCGSAVALTCWGHLASIA